MKRLESGEWGEEAPCEEEKAASPSSTSDSDVSATIDSAPPSSPGDPDVSDTTDSVAPSSPKDSDVSDTTDSVAPSSPKDSDVSDTILSPGSDEAGSLGGEGDSAG